MNQQADGYSESIEQGYGLFHGKVKWFNGGKGYGFIAPEAGGRDIFVHFSGIDGEGYRELQADQWVEFEVEETRKGLQAVNVRVVS